MKTKTFLLLCLILGMATTKLSAQDKDKKNENHAYASFHIYDAVIPVLCNNDVLVTTADYHRVEFLNNGLWKFVIDQIDGQATSSITDEVFKIHEVDKYRDISYDNESLLGCEITVRCNLIGNMGSHYIAHLVFELSDGGNIMTLTDAKTICIGF